MRQRAAIVAVLGLAQTLAYLGLVHQPPARGRTLPLTPLDDAIPYLPWTVWPYLLLLASDFVWPFFIRDRAVFRRTLAAYLIAIGTMFAAFAAWPTRMDRPLPPSGAGPTAAALRWLLAVDGDYGCFPSGHVVVPAIGCWALWRDRGRRAAWAVVAFALLAPSVLTTKQHYAWDVAGGLATAAAGVAASGWVCRAARRSDASAKRR